MVDHPISGIFYFVYFIIPPCFQTSPGVFCWQKSKPFLQKSIVFDTCATTFQGKITLKKYNHPWLIATIAISLFFFNLKNLNPYGTGHD